MCQIRLAHVWQQKRQLKQDSKSIDCMGSLPYVTEPIHTRGGDMSKVEGQTHCPDVYSIVSFFNP